jgi:hypothetical protein
MHSLGCRVASPIFALANLRLLPRPGVGYAHAPKFGCSLAQKAIGTSCCGRSLLRNLVYCDRRGPGHRRGAGKNFLPLRSITSSLDVQWWRLSSVTRYSNIHISWLPLNRYSFTPASVNWASLPKKRTYPFGTTVLYSNQKSKTSPIRNSSATSSFIISSQRMNDPRAGARKRARPRLNGYPKRNKDFYRLAYSIKNTAIF